MKFTYIAGSLFGSILLLQCCPVSGKASWHKVVINAQIPPQNGQPTMAA